MKISIIMKKRFTSLLLIIILAISVLAAAVDTFPVQAQGQGDRTSITFNNLTQVSPNRQYIVSVSADDLKMKNSTIWLGEPYEPDSIILVSDNGSDGKYWVTNPIWSPNSNEIAYLKVFSAEAENTVNAPRFELWAINIDGTSNRLLTNTIHLNPSLGLGGQTYLEWTPLSEIEFLDSRVLPIKKYAINTKTLRIREVGDFRVMETENSISSFNKTSPTNGSTIVSDNIPYYFLNWGSAGDTQYEYCVDTSNDNNCYNDNWITRTATYVTSQDLTFLEGGKTYYWQVRTKASTPIYANNGTWWNFKYEQGKPAAFSKTEPINLVVKTALPVTLKWSSSSAGVTYQYCISLLPTCTPSTSVGSATSVVWSPNPEPTGGIATYYWQVKAVNSQGETLADGGTIGSFVINIKPGEFAKTSPTNGLEVPMTPTLSWGVSTKASSYEYCISETQSCTSGVWVNVGNKTTETLMTPLAVSKTYYWQVRAKYSSVTTEANSGNWWSFKTVPPPGAFNKISPTESATDQPLSLTFEWESSTGATSYEYCYSSAAGPCTGWHSVGANTSVTLSGLAPNYTYYWQVRAVSTGGPTEANGGTWWSLTTENTPICSWPAYTPPTSPTFLDVPMSAGHWSWVERLANSGITSGCGNGNYCPFTEVVRAQMAIFLLRGKHCGSSYTPPAVGSSTGFNDVPLSASYAPWVKQLAAAGITAGCGNGNFCPLQSVNRAQMAIFLLRTKHGATYSPPGVGGSTGFNDVAANMTYAPWVKQLAAEGITAGCGSGNFCPTQSVNRAQMATFLVRAFGLP